MKKLITILTFFLLTTQIQAQDVDLLNRIKATNGKIKSFEADLSNTMVKSRSTESQEGKLYFVATHRFSAQFTTGKYMIVNDRKIKMNIGIFHGTYRLRGGMMESLADIFLCGFQGRLQELMDENGYNLSMETKDGYHIITGTVKRKKLIGVGYKQVSFKYHTDSLLLKEIILTDYSDTVDTYTISNVKYDVTVDQTMFDF